ncbi:class I SAM-dependent methyltransferase [Streptomyces sp. NPDC056161]|uniref:class I SAM-dependent methyltransferase n=1 Tax=Streptomyces sp. NPDC056161 TaxID=3345732 RepID=UPI0035D66EB5
MRHALQQDDPDIFFTNTAMGQRTLYIDGAQAMQEWEKPLMVRSGELVVRQGSEFLECGLGLGLSALAVAGAQNTTRHTVVERYQPVIDEFRKTHPSLPATLDIVQDDFFDHIERLPDESVDGIMFDPWLPKEIRDDESWWTEVIGQMIRIMRPGAAFVPFFSTTNELWPRFAPRFRTILVEPHPFTAYPTTSYTEGTSGTAYIQCFIK